MRDFWWDHGDLDRPLSRRDYLLYKAHRDWLLFSGLIFVSFCFAVSFIGVAAWHLITAGEVEATTGAVGFFFTVLTAMFWRGSRPAWEMRERLSRGYPERDE